MSGTRRIPHPDDAPSAPSPGGSRYAALHPLGRGGMGSVFAADDAVLGRRVALKRIDDGGDPERALREARRVAQVDHPNVVRVLDAGRDDAGSFLAMELLAGETLRALLDRQGTLPPREAVALLAPVADALAAVHALGLVHGDVKPENVMLVPRGGAVAPVLIDFGACIGAGERAVACTDGYAAPELLDPRRAADARADVWSLATVLAECVSGAASVGVAAPRALAAVIEAARADDPALRTRSMPEFARAMRAAVAPRPVGFLVVGAVALAAGLVVVAWRPARRAPVAATSPRVDASVVTEPPAAPVDASPAPAVAALHETPDPPPRAPTHRRLSPTPVAPRHWTDFTPAPR
ncbi:MAG: protein kinase [Polyangiales bacterium]